MKKIYNENLIRNLQIILNVKEEDLEKQDLGKIKSLSFSKTDKEGNQVYLINELLHFKGLQNLSIYNSKISVSDILILSKLENIEQLNFEHCYFEKESQNELYNIKKLKKLGLINCFIKDYSNIFKKMDLNSLEITFPYNEVEIDINSLKLLSNLEKLTLEGCVIKNEEDFSSLQNLDYLYLLSTKVNDLRFIEQMKKLDKIYISPQYLKNIDQNKSKVKIFTSSIDLLMDDENYSKNIV